MSVIIKNIRKPENCEDCYQFGRRISSETIECSVDTGWAYESNRYIRHDCPLVPLSLEQEPCENGDYDDAVLSFCDKHLNECNSDTVETIKIWCHTILNDRNPNRDEFWE